MACLFYGQRLFYAQSHSDDGHAVIDPAPSDGGEYFLDEVPQLSRFNCENCTCANGIAKQQYIRSNSFATEDTYTVQLLSCFYGIAIPRHIVFQCESDSNQAVP